MTDTTEDSALVRRHESDLLADIGVALWPQNLRVRVVLPAGLAQQAAAAWQRDDQDDAADETSSEREIRDRAGHAALVGLAVTERGTRIAGGAVAVDLDAWQVGAALAAADAAGRVGL